MTATTEPRRSEELVSRLVDTLAVKEELEATAGV
jgi:hypothetical protein